MLDGDLDPPRREEGMRCGLRTITLATCIELGRVSELFS